MNLRHARAQRLRGDGLNHSGWVIEEAPWTQRDLVGPVWPTLSFVATGPHPAHRRRWPGKPPTLSDLRSVQARRWELKGVSHECWRLAVVPEHQAFWTNAPSGEDRCRFE